MEEVLEVDLVLDESRGAVGAAKLHEPAGEVDAHLLVLEVVERQLLLAGVEDVPEVLDPHRRRRVLPEPEKKNEWRDWWGFWIGRI